MKAIIYRATNTATGKVYIGQTTQGLRARKHEHKNRFRLGERDHKLYMSMRKHGFEAFQWDVICCPLDRSMLDELETTIIQQYNSTNRNHGYNMSSGGGSVSDETREKLRQKMLGRKITWHDKIIEARRANGTLYGHEGAKGAANAKSRKYIVSDKDGHEIEIHGLRAFCRDHGLSHNLMIAVANGSQTHHKGYIVRRFNDYSERK